MKYFRKFILFAILSEADLMIADPPSSQRLQRGVVRGASDRPCALGDLCTDTNLYWAAQLRWPCLQLLCESARVV